MFGRDICLLYRGPHETFGQKMQTISGHAAVLANKLDALHLCKSEVGGEQRSEAETPTGNPSPAPTHPHRMHDTTDQWRDPRLWLG